MKTIHLTTLPRIIRRPRVCAYARVSQNDEIMESSFAQQLSHYGRLIRENPEWDFAGIYADDGISGTTIGRPGFASMMEDARSGRIDIILVKSISRFARNTVALLSSLRELRSLGVSVRFERENIDSMSTEGELMLTLLASFAEEESRSISNNTKWAIRKKFEEGIPQNRLVYGYLWTGGDFIIVDHEAEVVRDIFASYLAGESPQGIAKRLASRGERSKKGRLMCYASVFTILRNEDYTGLTHLQKTFSNDVIERGFSWNRGELPMFAVEGLFPRIISPEDFRKTRDEIALRASQHILASRTIRFTPFVRKVYCGDCGRAYRRTSTNRYVGWKCGTKIDSGVSACHNSNIAEHVLIDTSCGVLGMKEFDGNVFRELVERIVVHDDILEFHMSDGSVETVLWKEALDA